MKSVAPLDLVYLVGGMEDLRKGGSRAIEMMAKALSQKLGDQVRVVVHEYSLSNIVHRNSKRRGSAIPLFTCLSAESHARDLQESIDRHVQLYQPRRLFFIAYSAGSAILRHAIAAAMATTPVSWEKEQARPWPLMIKKIIHVGGMTTGWEFNSEVPKHMLWLGPIIRPFCPRWFPWQIYKGSKFITETRIALNRQLVPREGGLMMTASEEYLVGTKDEYITPADAIEVGGGTGKDGPRYIEVHGSTHATIMGDGGGANLGVRDYLCEAIGRNGSRGMPNGLKEIRADDIDDYLDPLDNEPATRDFCVEHAVIVLHGIRDNGMWAKRIGGHIKEKWR